MPETAKKLRLKKKKKKIFTNVLMLHVNGIKNTEMDKLVTDHLSQQPISHDGQRQMFKRRAQCQIKKLPVLPQNILPTLQDWQLTSLSKMSLLHYSGHAFWGGVVSVLVSYKYLNLYLPILCRPLCNVDSTISKKINTVDFL